MRTKPQYPKASFTNSYFCVYLLENTVKNVRWSVDYCRMTADAYEVTLVEDEKNGTKPYPQTGKSSAMRLQFPRSVVSKTWPFFGASPAQVKGNTVIIPKSSLISVAKRRPRVYGKNKPMTEEPNILNGATKVSLASLFEAMDSVNETKKALGSHCVLSIDPETGFLRALIER